MRSGFRFMALAVGALLMMSAPKAYGAMTFELLMQVGTDFIDVTNNGTTTTCTSSAGIATTSCGSGGSTVTGVPGKLHYDGNLDTYTVNVQTGISIPILSLPAIMDLGSQLQGAGTITVKFAVTGLTNPPVGPKVVLGGPGLAQGASLSAWYDSGNGNTIGSTTPAGVQFGTATFSGGQTVFSGSTSVTGTYSLTELLTYNGNNGAFLSSDISLNAVPEPASVALLGGVLLFSASLLRRKLNRA
jgi:hypothetical protein